MLVREIYENGQVVIPKHIRNMVGLKPHTKVSFSVENGRVIISKAECISEWARKVAEKVHMNDDMDMDEMYDQEMEEQTEGMDVR
jgi:AbrB family looped-hinge helix DNA binding protein